jgi:hypothetical protein
MIQADKPTRLTNGPGAPPQKSDDYYVKKPIFLCSAFLNGELLYKISTWSRLGVPMAAFAGK